MSALWKIVNKDDTEQDPEYHKYPGDPSSSGPARDPDPPSTKESDDKSPSPNTKATKSRPRRRGPLDRSSRSASKASSTAGKAAVKEGSPSRSARARRDSADSIGSMDLTGHESYGHGSPSTNMPSSSGRSGMPSRPIDGNIPLKLTPITRRVSRARKGVPVHVCEVCKPPKTFTRAEHLRRHQLSHKSPAYPCTYPGCDKSFHRADLLSRHASRHEQEDKSGSDMTRAPSRRSSNAPAEGTSSYSQSPLMTDNPISMASEVVTATYPGGNPGPYQSSHAGSSTGQPPMSPSDGSSSVGPSHPTGHGLSNVPHYISTTQATLDGSLLSTGYDALGFAAVPRTTTWELNQAPPSLIIPNTEFMPGLVSQDTTWPSSSASGSPYSTPSDRGYRAGGYHRAFGSPMADVAEHSPLYYAQYSSPQPQIYEHMAYSDESSNLYEFSSQPFHVRIPAPSTTMSTQPSQQIVTVGSPPVPVPATLSRQKSLAVLEPSSEAAFLTAEMLPPHVLKAIDPYLDVYWKRFDTFFPIVHRRSLETAADGVLCCAMAAIGSQFLNSREDRQNGHKLHQFAWQEAKRHPRWSVQVMQAIFLCEFFSRFRGLRGRTKYSEPFQSIYSRVAPDSQDLTDHTSTSASSRHWDDWIICETRRRLLAACFVLDVHTSVYHEHNPMHPFKTPTPPIPLTKSSQALWAAQTPSDWDSLLMPDPTQVDICFLSDKDITPDLIATAPPFDLAIYLASETLRLPRRLGAMDFSAEPDLSVADRVRSLFPGCAVAYTGLAFHFTPVQALLAVSGDSWLFAEKILTRQIWLGHKQKVKQWSSSAHASAAMSFASKALSTFLSTNNDDPSNQALSEEMDGGEWKKSNTSSDISEYWALFVCALICWAVTYGSTRSTRRGGDDGATDSSKDSTVSEEIERDAKEWLKTAAALEPGAIHRNLRGQREVIGVVGVVRKRLETEAVGDKNKLLVDAVRILKTIEDKPNLIIGSRS